MDDMNNVNTEQQPTTQPADNGTQGNERMFSQAEVDRIVKDRLARVKAAPKEPTEAEIKERELVTRENRLSCREYLIKKSYPRELLDILDTSDPKDFNKRADMVFGLMNEHASRNPSFAEPMRSTEPSSLIGWSGTGGFDRTKHKPKCYPYKIVSYEKDD